MSSSLLCSWLIHAVQAVLHMMQVSLGYMLMLCVMSYNTWIFLGVIVGSGLGYFISFPLLRIIWCYGQFRGRLFSVFYLAFVWDSACRRVSLWQQPLALWFIVNDGRRSVLHPHGDYSRQTRPAVRSAAVVCTYCPALIAMFLEVGLKGRDGLLFRQSLYFLNQEPSRKAIHMKFAFYSTGWCCFWPNSFVYPKMHLNSLQQRFNPWLTAVMKFVA